MHTFTPGWSKSNVDWWPVNRLKGRVGTRTLNHWIESDANVLLHHDTLTAYSIHNRRAFLYTQRMAASSLF